MSIAEMIDASPTAAVISDPQQPDNPIIACNEAFVRLTGYRREEIIGRNCRFLVGTGTDPDVTRRLREGIAGRQPVIVEILNYKKDGTPFRNAVMVAPIFDAEGALRYFLGSQMEVIAAQQPGETDRDRTAKARLERLSTRQREILRMMAEGQLNKQIAFRLRLSERTIKMHRAALFKALGVRTSADAIRAAVEAGL